VQLLSNLHQNHYNDGIFSEHMRTLIITLEYPPIQGGIAVSVHRIARQLLQCGIDVHILTVGEIHDAPYANAERKLTSEEEGGIFVHRMNPYSGTLTYCPPQDSQNLDFYIQELHNRFDFDVFHGFRIHAAGYLAVVNARRFKRRSIASIRGNDINRDIYNPQLFSSSLWTLSHATQITYVAREQLNFVQLFADYGQKSSVILNSLRLEDYAYKPVKIPGLHGFVVGFLGTGRAKKGLAYLFDAFARFRKSHDATLLLVGGFIPDEELSFMDLLEQYGIKDDVVVTKAEHAQVLNYLVCMDVFVLPSIEEGCPNALLEAMYCKRAIIASKVGAIPDMLGNSGIQIDSRNSEQIYKNLITLHDDAAMRNQYGARAFKRVKEGFMPETEKEEWQKLYDSFE